MSFYLFDRMRLLFKRGNIYGHESLFQNQSDINRVLSNGDSIDVTDPNFMLEQTNVQINRLERYKDYDQMDEVGEISLALDMYADEASLRDPERNHSLFVKTSNMRLKEEIEEFLYESINIDSLIRPMTRYLTKYGDLPLEIVPTQNRDGVAMLRQMQVYNFTRVETKYGDLVGFFFQEEGGEPVYMHPWQVAHLRLTSFEQIFHPYGRSLLDGARRDFRRLRLMEDAALVYRLCLRGDSKVWTPDGYKEIKDVKVNDEVYCFSKDQKVTKTKVINWVCNGRDKIYRVFSRHREIFANSTHPILVVSPYKVDGVMKYDRQEYVDVQDLKTLQNTRKEYCHRFLLPRIENTNYVELVMPDVPKYIRLNKPSILSIADGYKKALIGTKKDAKEFLNCERDLVIEKANVLCNSVDEAEYSIIDGWVFDCQKRRAKEFKIDTIATEEFAQWFGFMIGDGFVSERRSISGNVVRQIGFALGDDHDTNEKYKKLFEKIIDSEVSFGGDTGYRLGSYHVYSVHFLNFMKLNGFIPGSHCKRIPSWVYQSPRSVQEAFIDGYIDADGHRRIISGGIIESCECSCCNRELLEDIKELCHRLGWNVGIIRKCEKKGGHVIDQQTGRTMPDTIAWSLYFTKDNAPEHERILDVEEIEDDEIYDITVENEVHNILVDGIITAQTRAPEKRLFKVPVGNLPPKEREQYIQIIARRFKKHKFIDPVSGALNEQYAPHIQDDDYWVPITSDGSGVEVDTLQGAENLDAIADIEYFKKKMISALKIPFHRVGLGEAGDPGKSIASQSPEFAKAVQWIQDQIIVGVKKAVLVHLALKNYPSHQLKNFELGMTSASAIDELYRIETWASRVDIMGGLKDTQMFPDKWIVESFTNLTEDELKMIELTKQDDDDVETEDQANDFFENKKIGSLIKEMRRNEIIDLKESIKKSNKYGHHVSVQKMINENEFDGMDDRSVEDHEHEQAKTIIERILKNSISNDLGVDLDLNEDFEDDHDGDQG